MSQRNQVEVPLVSIIVPVYNSASYMQACLNSVFKQTIQNYELILVNDGSLDNSKKICEAACKADSRVQLLSYSDNKGPSFARNKGLDAAVGKYLFFLDSDDMIHPQLLENMVKQAEKFNADMVISSFAKSSYVSEKEWNSFCRNCLKWDWQFYDKEEVWEHWFQSKLWQFEAGKLYVTEALNSLRFNENVRSSEGRIFNYMFLLEKPRSIVYSDTKGYFYREREGKIRNEVFLERNQEYLSILRAIRDHELRLGREENAVILEEKYAFRLREWLEADSKTTGGKNKRQIKAKMNKEKQTELFQSISFNQKMLFYLGKDFLPLYSILKVLGKRIFHR